MSQQSFWKRLEIYPPILVRLLSRHPRGEPLSTAEIAASSGLTTYQVEALSWATSWRGIDIETFRKFTQACNLDLTNSRQMKRVTVYLNGKKQRNGERIPCPFRYLKKHREWPTYYLPMMASFHRSKIMARAT
jgi:hypothetical protein